MFFKKKKNEQIEDVEIIENDDVVSKTIVSRDQVATINVRDVKQYLVNEFDRVKELENQIEDAELLKEKYDELKIKYDATLVLLQENDRRVKDRDIKLETKSTKINELRQKIVNISEEKNDLKIEIQQLGRSKKEIEDNIIQCTKDNIAKKILYFVNNTKGAITKKSIHEFVNSELFGEVK